MAGTNWRRDKQSHRITKQNSVKNFMVHYITATTDSDVHSFMRSHNRLRTLKILVKRLWRKNRRELKIWTRLLRKYQQKPILMSHFKIESYLRERSWVQLVTLYCKTKSLTDLELKMMRVQIAMIKKLQTRFKLHRNYSNDLVEDLTYSRV